MHGHVSGTYFLFYLQPKSVSTKVMFGIKTKLNFHFFCEKKRRLKSAVCCTVNSGITVSSTKHHSHRCNSNDPSFVYRKLKKLIFLCLGLYVINYIFYVKLLISYLRCRHLFRMFSGSELIDFVRVPKYCPGWLGVQKRNSHRFRLFNKA